MTLIKLLSKTWQIHGKFCQVTMEQPQRRTPRFPFSAPAEVIRPDNQLVDRTRVHELSLYGCYLDTQTPLPRGTQVTVKIVSDGDFFEANATVIYSQPTLGMGVAFREIGRASCRERV